MSNVDLLNLDSNFNSENREITISLLIIDRFRLYKFKKVKLTYLFIMITTEQILPNMLNCLFFTFYS